MTPGCDDGARVGSFPWCSIGPITAAQHIVQAAPIFDPTVAHLPQCLFGDAGTAAAAAVQHDAGIVLRRENGDVVGDFIVGDVDRLADMGLLVLSRRAYIDYQRLARNGWAAMIGPMWSVSPSRIRHQ